MAIEMNGPCVYAKPKCYSPFRWLAPLAVGVFLFLTSIFPLAAKTIVAPKGQKTPVVFWKCVGWWYCNIKLHIVIRNVDGSPGRARLISTWEPGKTRDLDVHEGAYDDSLDAYVFMAYWLYAVAETDGVEIIVGNDVAP